MQKVDHFILLKQRLESAIFDCASHFQDKPQVLEALANLREILSKDVSNVKEGVTDLVPRENSYLDKIESRYLKNINEDAFTKLIKEKRLALGMSQLQLAQRVKVSRVLLAHYETMRRHIPTHVKVRLIKTLNIRQEEIPIKDVSRTACQIFIYALRRLIIGDKKNDK